jgi:hypothetical protein
LLAVKTNRCADDQKGRGFEKAGSDKGIRGRAIPHEYEDSRCYRVH